MSSNSNNSDKKTRPKERNISHIIKKVYKWRQLYTGFTDKYGKWKKMSLKEAAKVVEISKKSLDDYLL